MTGRRAYEMFTRAFGKEPGWYSSRPQSQFGDHVMVAYDFLGESEKAAWKRVADQIDQRTARSVAARKVST